MYKAIIFGGTSEGREIYEQLGTKKMEVLYCTATEYGAELVEEGESVRYGRMERGAMMELFKEERPKLVVDATHPYAGVVSRNIKEACREAAAEYLRVTREESKNRDITVATIQEAVEYLNKTDEIIFSALGSKEVSALTKVNGWKERVWLRILPTVESVMMCLEAGYATKRLICMQGPFSKELNSAMFRETGAGILITKESGKRGGFDEKIAAAREVGMAVLVLKRPEDFAGVKPELALERILAL